MTFDVNDNRFSENKIHNYLQQKVLQHLRKFKPNTSNTLNRQICINLQNLPATVGEKEAKGIKALVISEYSKHCYF